MRVFLGIALIILAGAGLAQDYPARPVTALGKGLASAEVRERFAAQGAEVAGGSPEQLAAALRDDVVKWARVVRAAGVKID